MNKKEFLQFWKERIDKLITVVSTLSSFNCKVFMTQVLPLRDTDSDEYWRRIEYMYDDFMGKHEHLIGPNFKFDK